MLPTLLASQIDCPVLCRHFAPEVHYLSHRLWGGREKTLEGYYYQSAPNWHIPPHITVPQFCQALAPQLEFSRYQQIGGRNGYFTCFYLKNINLSPLTKHSYIAYDEYQSFILES